METGEESLFYQFEKLEDLTDKAELFEAELNKLQAFTESLNRLVKNNLEDSEGELITSIIEEVDTTSNKNLQLFEESKLDMQRFAINYTEIINDMKMQKVILYYEIITLDEM
ncbi:hypothetical protein [Oceanobacillus sp. CFH 90083]|uniref:hypothetical protein n=1 Tax=Oceanobacillus sp. CFH 90083 TaxID=2592336 RepID=UPI00128B4FFA|nr:hypothetical protein [Oceanobacillus sp. CFH 90083]